MRAGDVPARSAITWSVPPPPAAPSRPDVTSSPGPLSPEAGPYGLLGTKVPDAGRGSGHSLYCRPASSPSRAYCPARRRSPRPTAAAAPRWSRGTTPPSTPRWKVAQWDPALCVQCGNCSFACPHTSRSAAGRGSRHWRCRHAALGATAQDDLERSGVGWPGEHIVGLLELIQREPVGDKPSGVDVVAGEQAQQCRRGVRVD
jgi:ferredoxin